VGGRDEGARSEGSGGAEVRPTGEAEDYDDEHGNPHGDGAEVMGPFSEIEAE